MNNLLSKNFKVTIPVDISELREHLDFFLSNRDTIIKQWIEDQAAKQELEKLMSIEVFVLEYAYDIYNYYLSVIGGQFKLGNCPSMQHFLAYCSQEKAAPHSLYLICSGLRKSIVVTVLNEAFFTKEIYKQITLITDQNLAGVIHIYSEILRHNKLEIEHKNKQLLEQYLYDELTTLKNINALKEDLVDDTQKLLILFDINRLNEINTSYGYESGNIILIQMADFLSEVYEEYNSQIYRLFGDEFAVLLKIEEIDETNLELLAQSFQDKLIATSFSLANEIINKVPIQVSIGISTIPNLLIHASAALYNAKTNNLAYVIHQKSDLHITNHATTINQLHDAIQNARIVTYFQPIVYNETKQIRKYETLMRMLDENNEPISPFFFLDASKKARLYPLLTAMVIDQASNMFHKSSHQFSINIEREDIINATTRSHILHMISLFDEPHRIVFELVESEMISDDKIINDFLETLRNKGCQLAIDDFGSGFSNFEYLLRIKANFIKIDGSLIKDIDTNFEKRAIVKSIVSFAQDIGIETIAEYVSSEEIFNIVKEMGITYSQGFYFGKPLPTILK